VSFEEFVKKHRQDEIDENDPTSPLSEDEDLDELE
jgi:hypothetical protein